jgi:hypothetical protein
MENKYKEGDVVYERIRPTQKLIVKLVLFDVYYCQPEESNKRELVFFERDLAQKAQSAIALRG